VPDRECDALMIDEVFVPVRHLRDREAQLRRVGDRVRRGPARLSRRPAARGRPNGSCWTHGCVPIAACNVVPSCADCPKSQMCVIDETIQGQKHRCEPIPPECMGAPTCACAGDACDTPPYDTCAENQNGLLCSCPNC
jgi:hypothetical protein